MTDLPNNALQPTSPKAWKAKSAAPVTLPSGNVIRMRKIGMQTLIATGKVPNALMGIMQRAVDKGQGLDGVDTELSGLMGDPKALKDLTRFFDDLIVMTSIEPKIHPTPASEDDRDEDKLYADEVDEEDKQFLFQLMQGGTDDVATFRREHSNSMAAVLGREDVVVSTE